MKRLGVSAKIIVIVGVSFLLVEAVILLYTGANRRDDLVDHYVFQASILTATVDPAYRSDQRYLDAVARRLADEKVLSIRPFSGEPGETWTIQESVMMYRNHRLEVEIDVSGIPGQVRTFIWNVIGLVAVILVCLVATSYFFMRIFVVRPLRALLANLNAISGSEADLSARLAVQSNDEIGQIALSFNRFIERIREMVVRMKEASDTARRIGTVLVDATTDSVERLRAVSKAAATNGDRVESLDREIHDAAAAVNEISASTDSLSISAERQAQEVADSLAAVEEMNASIASLVDLATQRRAGATALLGTTRDANEKMSESVSAIRDIEASTEEMLGMIDVINAIAGRTNLLSMNAAIEAAHAGEYGRGFAVVAEEIRKLSDQTAENAKSITRTLKAEVEKIAVAGEINRSAGELFERILHEVESVVDAMQEMVAGMNEQSVASGEIMRAVSTVDQVAAEIKNASREISGGTTAVSGSFDAISGVSADVSERVRRVIADIQTVTETVETIARTGSENERNVEILDGEAARFTL
ncbi:MAG: HAMP domain-containing protein [Spirochaetaceae bacterium]|nr:MAG: HAMP domain-containing protein [Spirochaetaceae bacterium]